VSTVEEIEAAIEKLFPEDFRRLARWIEERDSDGRDKQIEEDARTGRLDHLYERLVKENTEESGSSGLSGAYRWTRAKWS
jgi:hypothetical protein